MHIVIINRLQRTVGFREHIPSEHYLDNPAIIHTRTISAHVINVRNIFSFDIVLIKSRELLYIHTYFSCLLPSDYYIECCLSISYFTMHRCICILYILIFILCLYHNYLYFYLILCLCRCFSTFHLMQQPIVFVHDKLLFHFRYLRTKTYCLLLMILHLRTYI